MCIKQTTMMNVVELLLVGVQTLPTPTATAATRQTNFFFFGAISPWSWGSKPHLFPGKKRKKDKERRWIREKSSQRSSLWAPKSAPPCENRFALPTRRHPCGHRDRLAYKERPGPIGLVPGGYTKPFHSFHRGIRKA